MVGRQENFCGNILFYEYLSKKRAPVALIRYLTRAWRVHRHLSDNTSTIGFAGDHYDLRPVWEPPSRATLDDMVEDDKSRGTFVLEIHGITPITTTNTKPITKRVEPASKARALLQVKSTVQVAVFSPLSDLPCLSKPPQNATLQSTSRQADGAVAVETERISFSPKNFSSHIPLIETNDAYKMNISLNLESQEHAEELYGHVALRNLATQDVSTRLSATWPNILKCPPGKTVLRLRDWKDFLRLGLEVTMYWTPVTGESILARHNRHLRASALQPVAYPTPPPPTGPGMPKYKIVFVYKQKTIERDNLGCPHEGCERRGHTDIDGLRMHLDSWHDYFKYKANKQISEDDGKEVWVFQCDVSDHRAHRAEQRASGKVDEPFDVQIIPPSQPFNQRQYLDEDNDYYQRTSRVNKHYAAPRAALAVATSSHIPLRKSPHQVQDKPTREKKRYPVPEAPAGITFFRSCSRRPLVTGEYISESDDEVDDSWIKLRKSAEFEKEEHIPTSVKKLLKAFDWHMWSEQLRSDVHVGDAMVRFARVNRHWIWQEGVCEAFKNKMYELLQDDIISKQVHAECLDIVENAKPDVADEGNRLSQQLSQMEVSHDHLYGDRSRRRITQSPELTAPADSVSNGRMGASRRTRIDKGKGKARVTDTGHLTPITADSDGDLEMREATLIAEKDLAADRVELSAPPPPYDLCLCGKDAQASTRKSQMIACTSMNCIRRSFHFDCIKERWKITQNVRDLRKSAWICEDCRPQPTMGN